MQDSDHENAVFALPIKDGVVLVIMAAYRICNFREFMSHQRRTGQKFQDSVQFVGIGVSLKNFKMQQGALVDSCKIFCRQV